jgi:P4 family phage/plasmid primase-like protien
MANLIAFLQANKSENVFTHLSFRGGKYFIKDEDLQTFYDLYYESVFEDHNPEFLVEKNTPIGCLRVDFDFIYDSEIKTHQHTQDQLLAFTKAYMQEISEYLQLPPKVEIFVMEKRKPTIDAKNRSKSGFHLVIPELNTTSMVEQSVRRSLLRKNIETYFPDLPITETWDKIYDEGVVKRSQGWMLYGSRKWDRDAPTLQTLPYETKYVITYPDFTIEAPPKITSDLIKRLSIRRKESEETLLTEKGQMYAAQPEPRISGGRAVTPARGRPAQRSEKPSSRASSPQQRIRKELDPEEKQYIKDHALNLKNERYSSYAEWVEVGICLHNIHLDLLDVFLDFSSQDSEKYNEADCIQKWNSFTFRNDGDRTGIGSLRYWSRTDDFEGYQAIEKSYIGRLVEQAASCTEHDVAKVIYAKFRDHYKCSDFGKNVWYRWAGHIWVETDSGVDLQIKLSSDIADMFQKRATLFGLEVEGKKCASAEKDKCGECTYCRDFKKQMDLLKVVMKLKSTGFKANTMKECRELFFDEQFTKKVDSNKDLVAFNNGILNLVDFTFRAGKPEDYISFSTEIDYDEEKPYYDYAEWPSINTFIAQVLPDPEVRTYFMNHLATCLVGGNKSQKFHILTGSGSNGKSMLMNLTSKALGDYAAVVPITLFTQKRAGSGSAAPEVIRLKGRRFVTMQEPDEKVALNTGLMKQISSGEKMYARDLFKSGVEFEVQAKFHLACNDKPEIHSTDGGTWRRLVVINYTSKFVDKPTEAYHFPIDEAIQHAVNSVQWATPFLAYLVYLLKEQRGQKINPPGKVLEYTDEYRNDTDGIAKFLSEKTEPFEGEPLVKAQLQSVFKQWKIQNEQLSLSLPDLTKRLIERYGKMPTGGWTNFRLKD